MFESTHEPIDMEFVEAQFPAFSEDSLKGWAHFENAGGSYACAHTVDALTGFYRRTKLQPYGPARPTAEAGEAMDRSRARWAEALGVTPEEVVFGPSTSQNTYTLSHAFRPLLSPGDEIIVTEQDHEANSGAWRRMAEETGLSLREWTVDPDTGLLDPADFEALLSERTKLVCFPHCSNIAGQENPVARLTGKAREVGAWVVVDAVSWAPHEIADVALLGPDVYMFSLYKVFGPHQGLMTVRAPLMERLANQSHFFNAGSPASKLNPAGPDHAQVGASGAVIDYIDAFAAHHGLNEHDLRGRVRHVCGLWRARERALTAPVLGLLKDHPGARLIGSSRSDEGRAPTIAFTPSKMAPEAFVEALAQRGIIAGAGHFYAYRLIRALGIAPESGVVRVSMTHYTTGPEVSGLISALEELL